MKEKDIRIIIGGIVTIFVLMYLAFVVIPPYLPKPSPTPTPTPTVYLEIPSWTYVIPIGIVVAFVVFLIWWFFFPPRKKQTEI